VAASPAAAPPTELERLGLTVIELSEIGDSNYGSHSKFSGSPEVVQIIGAGLNTAGRFGETSSIALDDILAGSPIRVLGN
jgi:esterase/lipase superfamily enzyme